MGMSEFGIGETETVTKFHEISWLKPTYHRFSWVIRLFDTNWSLPQDYLGFLVVILTASQLRNPFPHSKNITQLRSSTFFLGEWQLWLIAPVLDVIGRCSTTVNFLVIHAPFGAKVAATGLPPVTCPSLTCHDWESCFGFNMLAGLIPHFREIHCVGKWRATASVVPIPYCAVHFLRALWTAVLHKLIYWLHPHPWLSYPNSWWACWLTKEKSAPRVPFFGRSFPPKTSENALSMGYIIYI